MLICYFQNFTIENGVYKGQVKPNLTHYKSFGELMWITIKSHGNKISHVSKKLLLEIIAKSIIISAIICFICLQDYQIKP